MMSEAPNQNVCEDREAESQRYSFELCWRPMIILNDTTGYIAEYPWGFFTGRSVNLTFYIANTFVGFVLNLVFTRFCLDIVFQEFLFLR